MGMLWRRRRCPAAPVSPRRRLAQRWWTTKMAE